MDGHAAFLLSVFAAVLALGVTCGLLGGLLVVRRQALLGDVLAHAVLPGIAGAFLLVGEKDPLAMLAGAACAGLAGSLLVGLLRSLRGVREDSALALVLTGFFGVGVLLVTLIQNQPNGRQSGLDHVFFGQLAGLSPLDLGLMGGVAAATLLVLLLGYKEIVACSFDPGFARVAGLRPRLAQGVFLVLLALGVVVSLRAVGVVLVTALLVTPAATAALLTRRLPSLLLLAVILSWIAGLAGAAASMAGRGLPTGPFMVLAAGVIFMGVVAFEPRRGLVPRWVRERLRKRRVDLEDALKHVYLAGEGTDRPAGSASLGEMAALGRAALGEAEHAGERLVRAGLATMTPAGGREGGAAFTSDRVVTLTEAGTGRARTLVRNHRLWETYLARRADYPADHVHEDAEAIEHLLSDEVVRRIDERLGHPRQDPHGRAIPRTDKEDA